MIQLYENCKIYNDNVEASAMQTIYDVMKSGAFNSSQVRIMPDVHDGKGIVIGFTAPLDNYINPNHVGVDIGCCIDTWFTNIPIETLHQKDLKNIERRIRNTIPFGLEINSKCIVDTKDFLKYLNQFVAKCASKWDRIDYKIYTEKDIDLFCNRIGQDPGIFWKSLGSVGSGNHFIEFGSAPNKKGIECLNFTIHCGSRNLGVKVATYHCGVAEKLTGTKSKEFKEILNNNIKSLKAAGKLNVIEDSINTLKKEWKSKHPEGYLHGEYMNAYLNDMVLATAYSLYNHETIAKSIHSILKRTVANAMILDKVRSIHNYIDMEDHIIRKGAIRAYEGELMVVPFNMRDGLAICRGKGNSDWNYSCSHGAGRKMSRSQAKKSLSLDKFTEQMEGIITTSVCPNTIDEAPDAYKDTNEIVSLIQDTCEILYFIKPIINLKAKDS